MVAGRWDAMTSHPVPLPERFGALLGQQPGSAAAPLGMFVKIPSLEVCELVGDAGFQFVVIDTEHALLSVRDVYEMIVTYSNSGVRPLVRVTDHSYGDAQRYLDAGAAGILVPHVADGAQARTVVDQLRFPPEGTRGQGAASRAGRWGAISADEYRRFGREDALRILMIEDHDGVENIAEILGTPGLSAVFVGPGDLRLSMGDASHDEVMAAIDAVIAAAVAASVPVGTVVIGAEQARRRIEQGCDFLVYGNDSGIIGQALRDAAHSAREALTLPTPTLGQLRRFAPPPGTGTR